jgi:chitinase
MQIRLATWLKWTTLIFPIVSWAQAEFKVVGYLPSWNIQPVIQYQKLTHIMWSFASPSDNGVLSGWENPRLTQLVLNAHAGKVKVFLALGGGGQKSKGWSVCSATDVGRQALVKSCMAAIKDYQLDGIDLDWEYPQGSQVPGYNALVKLLAAALHAEGKQLSAAVTESDWPHSFPTQELYSHFDFLNIMVYYNPVAPHSSVDAAKRALNLWVNTKGLPKEKAILGCPFYGPSGTYKQIIASDPAAAWVDANGSEGYNSIPTIKKKTEIALDQSGGIMFWELTQDAVGPLSLLSAVNEVILKRGVTEVRNGDFNIAASSFEFFDASGRFRIEPTKVKTTHYQAYRPKIFVRRARGIP